MRERSQSPTVATGASKVTQQPARVLSSARRSRTSRTVEARSNCSRTRVIPFVEKPETSSKLAISRCSRVTPRSMMVSRLMSCTGSTVPCSTARMSPCA